MRQRYENFVWQQILLDRLKRRKLEIALANLAKRENEEWVPFYYKSNKDERDMSGVERTSMAEWQGAAAIGFHWGVETRFDAVSLFDDVMRRVRVAERLQGAVAAATLCIAAKLNEEEENISFAPEIIAKLKVDMAPKDLSRMEVLLLRKLQWHPRRCLALGMLQTMMALVAVKVSYCVRGKDFRDEFLHLFLEIQTRWLFILVVQSESASVRPSVLALSLVYFHLEWEKRSHLKGQLIPWFQRILMVSSAELEYGLKFSYPLVGFNFYPERSSSLLPRKEDQPSHGTWPRGELISDKTTRYDTLQRERISSSQVYFHMRKELGAGSPAQISSSSEEEEKEDQIPLYKSSEGSKNRRRKCKKQRSSCKTSSQPRYVVSRRRRAAKRFKAKGVLHQSSSKKARSGDANKENENFKGTKEIEVLLREL